MTVATKIKIKNNIKRWLLQQRAPMVAQKVVWAFLTPLMQIEEIIHAGGILHLFFQNYKKIIYKRKFLSIFYFDASCMQFSIKMKFLKEFTWYYMNNIFSPSNSAPATVQLFVTNKSKFIVVILPNKSK